MGRVREAWDYLRYARVVRNAPDYASLLPDFFSSYGTFRAETFSAVHTMVIFAGIGRSGTTLLGALLDAHPNMVIANEQNVFKYLQPLPFSRQQIFQLLLRNSARAAAAQRPGGGGYVYAVPGQWQGRSNRIEVIGDKSRSAQSVEWLYSRPELAAKLRRTARAKIRVIHVIRNPFDTIARRSLRRGVSLGRISREYFVLTEKLQKIREYPDLAFLPVYLEDVISDPVGRLAEICRELGVEPSGDYLEACAGIVHTQPGEPRKTVTWPEPVRTEIIRRMKAYPYLQRYSFE
jgi:hypothetical protein